MKNLKYSKYNTVLDLGERLSVLYNSKEDKFLVFGNEKKELLRQSPQALQQTDFDLFNNLKNINAIVQEDKNELQEVIQKSKDIDNADDRFRLIINPTMNCNFKCWYCYETHVEGSKISNDGIEKICKFIDNTIRKNGNLRSFDLSFFGGEPLMYYSRTSLPIIDFIRSKYEDYPYINFSISFTSNGYLLNERILNHLLEKDEHKHFQITLDGNREEHNKVRVAKKAGGSYDKIIESINTLTENGVEVLLRVNYTAENLNSTKEILNDISYFSDNAKKNLDISFHRVWQDYDNKIDLENRVSEILKSFNEMEFKTQNDDILDNLINSCYADKKNEAVINYNGNVYKCTARDFNEENKYGELNEDGTINWNEKLTKWENIKIQSKACQNCRILPLCGGGCHQVNLEAEGLNICQMGFDDKKKDEIVMKRLYHSFEYEEA